MASFTSRASRTQSSAPFAIAPMPDARFEPPLLPRKSKAKSQADQLTQVGVGDLV